MSDIQPYRRNFFQSLLVTGMCQSKLLIPIENPDSISKNIDRKFDDKSSRIPSGGQKNIVRNSLSFLDKFIARMYIPIQILLQ